MLSTHPTEGGDRYRKKKKGKEEKEEKERKEQKGTNVNYSIPLIFAL